MGAVEVGGISQKRDTNVEGIALSGIILENFAKLFNLLVDESFVDNHRLLGEEARDGRPAHSMSIVVQGPKDATRSALDTGTRRVLVTASAPSGEQDVEKVVVTDVKFVRVYAYDRAIVVMHLLNLVGESLARCTKEFVVGLIPASECCQFGTRELCERMERDVVDPYKDEMEKKESWEDRDKVAQAESEGSVVH